MAKQDRKKGITLSKSIAAIALTIFVIGVLIGLTDYYQRTFPTQIDQHGTTGPSEDSVESSNAIERYDTQITLARLR